jgi:hypothetical protein
MCAALILILSTTTAYATIIYYFTKADFDAAVSTTLLEDFENIQQGVQMTSFVSHGVTYAGVDGGNVFVAPPYYYNFGAGVPNPINTAVLTANGPENFSVEFSTTPTAVGFDTYFNGLAPTTVQFFSTQGLLDTFVFDASLDNKGYLGVVSSDPITSFRWTNMEGGVLNTGIDNISVSYAVPVPEPSVMAFLGICVISLVGLRRWWKD